MAFFKTTPDLPDDERARVEFHLQQISEHIGFDRFTLPVLGEESVLYGNESGQRRLRTTDQIKILIGKHLGHDVNDVKVQSLPMQSQKIGGGG